MIGYPWITALKTHNISILILNRGAHFVDNATLVREVKETLQYVRTNFPHISIIWRNTPPGHSYVYGSFFHAPLTTPPDNKYFEDTDAKFHYADFAGQNALIYELLHVHFPEVVYLDVFTPTVMREDSHIDELHYCSVGPMSTWVQLVYNILLNVHTFKKNEVL